MLEQPLGLVQFAAGGQVAGLFGDDPGLVKRVGFLLATRLGLLHRPVQQILACLSVAAGDSGVGCLP